MDNEFIDRVLDYTQRSPDYRARAMAELAPGIVAVYDGTNEIETYFDRERWEKSVQNSEVWKYSLFPPRLNGTGMGILPGVGNSPQISDFDQALEYAQRYLKSTAGIKMHEQPQKVDLEKRL